jgi:hypothetical protein
MASDLILAAIEPPDACGSSYIAIMCAFNSAVIFSASVTISARLRASGRTATLIGASAYGNFNTTRFSSRTFLQAIRTAQPEQRLNTHRWLDNKWHVFSFVSSSKYDKSLPLNL